MPLDDFNAIFVHGGQSDEAAVSGGSWLAGLPLGNVQKDRFELIARSSNLNVSSTTMHFALKHSVSLGVFCLGWTNLSKNAKIRISAWPTSSFAGTALLDTGFLSDRVVNPDDGWRNPNLIVTLSEPVNTRFIKIEINDEFNPIGHVDISRVLFGSVLKVGKNYSFNNGLSFKQNSVISQTLSGGEIVWDRPEPRVWRGAFEFASEDEVYVGVAPMLRRLARGGQIVLVPDPSDTPAYMQERAFIGRITAKDSLTERYFGIASWGLEITEVLGPAPITSGVGVVTGFITQHDSDVIYSPLVSEPVINWTTQSAVAAALLPSVVAGDSIIWTTLSSAAAPYALEVSTAAIVSLPAAQDADQIYLPQVLAGSGVIFATQSSVALPIAPAIATAQIVELVTVADAAVAYAPDVNTAAIVQLSAMLDTDAVYAPQVSAGASVNLETVVSAATAYSPRAISGETVNLVTIEAGTAVFLPTVGLSVTIIQLSTLADYAVPYLPVISAGASVEIAAISTAAIAYAPRALTGAIIEVGNIADNDDAFLLRVPEFNSEFNDEFRSLTGFVIEFGNIVDNDDVFLLRVPQFNSEFNHEFR